MSKDYREALVAHQQSPEDRRRIEKLLQNPPVKKSHKNLLEENKALKSEREKVKKLYKLIESCPPKHPPGTKADTEFILGAIEGREKFRKQLLKQAEVIGLKP